MSGSTFGTIFKIMTWGESHGKALGVVIDGCPAGICLNKQNIQNDLDKRKPGTSAFSTPRKESDQVEILSGIFEGKTTGTPISLIVYNNNQRSKDYSNIANIYRPGHADYTYEQKYGIRDYRGGGRSSGRETIGRVAAGAVAKALLNEIGIKITTYTKSIGDIEIKNFDKKELYKNHLYIPDKIAFNKASEYLEKIKNEGDSVGGIVECIAENIPTGFGEPVFKKLDAILSQSIFSIGGVKGVEIGNGFECAKLKGSQNNDPFCITNGNIYKSTNNSGGILGGISDGSNIILRVAFKPTPSIRLPQKTVDKFDNTVEIEIGGRHDPIIVPRAVIVVESMVAITLADFMLQRLASDINIIKKIYSYNINPKKR